MALISAVGEYLSVQSGPPLSTSSGTASITASAVILGGLGVLAGIAARRLLGRLRRGARVPPPWCELCLGLCWAGAGGLWAAGAVDWRFLPLLLGISWLAVTAGTVDLVHHRLPDALTLPALPPAVMLAVPLGGGSVERAVFGALALGGVYLAVRLVMPSALGAGDVKLSASVGAALAAVSWPALWLGAVLASVCTALVTVIFSAVSDRRVGASGRPHGPAMLASAWFVLMAGAVSGGDVGA